jgi:hypothetical protein
MTDFKKLADDRQKQIETLEAELADFQEMSKQLEAEMVSAARHTQTFVFKFSSISNKHATIMPH